MESGKSGLFCHTRELTDKDCWAQNGSTHGRVFGDFQTLIFSIKKQAGPVIEAVTAVCLLVTAVYVGFFLWIFFHS